MPDTQITQLDASTVQRIFRAVRRVESLDKTGNVPMPQAARSRTVPFVNGSGLMVPPGGAVHLLAYDADELYFQAVRPGSPYIDAIGFAVDEVPIGSDGRAWVHGRIRMRLADWATVTNAMFPFSAITQVDSFDIRRHFGDGQILVWTKCIEEPFVIGEIVR